MKMAARTASRYASVTRERFMSGAFVRAVDDINATRVREADERIPSVVLGRRCDSHGERDGSGVPHRRSRRPRPHLWTSGARAFQRDRQRRTRGPCRLLKAGLPLGMQIVGKPYSEALIYRVAHAYEQATQWVEQHPALA
jgi:aspartyl-tRNA(Asn)/glutamyl-tRNA(Gln) amidotransferase subunit A